MSNRKIKKIDNCSKCGKEIIWLTHNKSGNAAPIEATASAQGNIVISREKNLYRIATNDDKKLAEETGKNCMSITFRRANLQRILGRKMRKSLPPDKKDVPPQTIPEARELIRKIFSEQGKTGWDEDEQKQYFEMIGVEGMESAADVRAIVADMVKAKIIIY